MITRRYVAITMCLTCTGGGTFVATLSSASPADAGRLTITSTLDGKRVVPTRFRWLARPSVASSRVARVDFLIDGRLRGIERQAPYNYGSDDLHGHLGWLVTTFLSPGRHRFTARAHLKDGRTASKTVTARVLRPPAPPAQVAGRWARTVTDGEIRREDPASVGDLPSGRWELVLDRVGAWDLDPKGSGVAEHVSVRGARIDIDAGLWLTPADADGDTTTRRYGHTNIGSGFCREDGPPGTYRWSVSANRLTLTPIRDSCRSRRAVWRGTWARTA